MKYYDYIIAGAGCSGRSLAVRLLPYLLASKKTVLIIDSVAKKTNDRTWCFWEKEADIFDSIVYRKWQNIELAGNYINKEMNINPYIYKMIRGEDFYKHTDKLLAENNQITLKYGKITQLSTAKDKAIAIVDEEYFSAHYIFSSIPESPHQKLNHYQYLLQHFRGWTIQTKESIFDPKKAKLMDFNTPQKEGTSFVYVLPLSADQALIEYTVFSENELHDKAYDEALQTYIREQLKCKDYKIIETEHGIIPMTDHSNTKQQDRIIKMGTAGGFTKGSTGYTFRFIQKHTKSIVQQLTETGKVLNKPIYHNRFNTYDGILLYLLNKGQLPGEQIFSTLFKNNKPVQVLKFLDNETSFLEELKIFSTLDKTQFALAFIKRALGFTKSIIIRSKPKV